MKNDKSIIDEYRNADTGDRLYMFLDCRELRREFMQIDLEEYRTTVQTRKSSNSVPEGTLKGRWLSAVMKCCPRLLKA